MNDLLIREANVDDSVEIVSLLKNTLGESLLPKTVDYWNWKHYHNPFGISKIIVAKFNTEIIGVRAFLKWKWQNKYTTINAIRAVDTATAKEFQSKGVFKKLTLFALAQCKSEGIDLVFNTPNKISKPGYIKMGWEENGRMPIQIKPCFHIPSKFNEQFVDNIYAEFLVNDFATQFNEYMDFSNHGVKFNTVFSEKYYKWRYADCPTVEYGFKGCVDKYFIFFRLKKIDKFIELRICDFWIKKGNSFEKLFLDELTQLVKRIRPLLVSFAPDFRIPSKNALWFNTNKGPITTVRKLSSEGIEDFRYFKNWQPSIGTMELF
jgi:GNAT superfamily N-acetyltransferase